MSLTWEQKEDLAEATAQRLEELAASLRDGDITVEGLRSDLARLSNDIWAEVTQ